MSEERNIQVVQEAYGAFARGEIPALLGLLTEDVEWIQPGPPERIASAGRRIGHDGVAEYFRLIAETFDIEDFQPRQFVAQDDTVVVLGRYRRRVRATGRLDDSEWVHVFVVADGRIARHQAFVDTASTLAALEAG